MILLHFKTYVLCIFRLELTFNVYTRGVTLFQKVGGTNFHFVWKFMGLDDRAPRIEAPKVSRGWGSGRGFPPPCRGRDLGRGLSSLPRKFFII